MCNLVELCNICRFKGVKVLRNCLGNFWNMFSNILIIMLIFDILWMKFIYGLGNSIK